MTRNTVCVSYARRNTMQHVQSKRRQLALCSTTQTTWQVVEWTQTTGEHVSGIANRGGFHWVIEDSDPLSCVLVAAMRRWLRFARGKSVCVPVSTAQSTRTAPSRAHLIQNENGGTGFGGGDVHVKEWVFVARFRHRKRITVSSCSLQ